jgi:hypothetical protein
MAEQQTTSSSSSKQRSEQATEAQTTTQLTPVQDMIDYYREYAREKPEVVALWCLDIGFVLGWKLKPW